MRKSIIFLIVLGLFFTGLKIIQAIKFETVVWVSVFKGPFKGLTFKAVHYKISYNDLQFKNDFWNSDIGEELFKQLSTTLQTLIKAAHKYVSVELDTNYLGLMNIHHKITEVDGVFVLVRT